MNSKEREFWTKVRARQEAYEEAIRIRKRKRGLSAVERREFVAGLMPKSSPPFAYRLAFEVAGSRPVSQAEIEEAAELFRRRNAIHKVEEPYSSVEEFALGIRVMEMADARRKALKRTLRRMVAEAHNPDEPYCSPHGMVPLDPAKRALLRKLEALNVPAPPQGSDPDPSEGEAVGPWRMEAHPICQDEWDARGHSMETVPPELILAPKDRELAAAVLAALPGRKRGRPPSNGLWPATSTERSRKYRKRMEKAA